MTFHIIYLHLYYKQLLICGQVVKFLVENQVKLHVYDNGDYYELYYIIILFILFFII